MDGLKKINIFQRNHNDIVGFSKFALPRILTDIGSLVSGGIKWIVMK
jgi:hypothetical protein